MILPDFTGLSTAKQKTILTSKPAEFPAGGNHDRDAPHREFSASYSNRSGNPNGSNPSIVPREATADRIDTGPAGWDGCGRLLRPWLLDHRAISRIHRRRLREGRLHDHRAKSVRLYRRSPGRRQPAGQGRAVAGTD